MEPAAKKVRLTDHFRVALKPRDLNVTQQLKNKHNNKRIEVVTLADNASDNNINVNYQQQSQQQNLWQASSQQPTKQQEQTFPLKVVASISQPTASSQQDLKSNQQNHIQQQQQSLLSQKPRQHLGSIALNNNNQRNNNHSQAKGKKKSISNKTTQNNHVTLHNTKVDNILNKNKCITDYLVTKPVESSPINKYVEPPGIEPVVFDYDKTVLNNVYWEPHYAWESFAYDKKQEIKYKTGKPLYLSNNTNLQNTRIEIIDGSSVNLSSGATSSVVGNFSTKRKSTPSATTTSASTELQIGTYDGLTPRKRAELVDWLVDIQINYDLDHEPLYMAVKLVNQYLMHKQVPQGHYELLFMVALLISAKFDERIPPVSISELLEVTESRFGTIYSRKQVINLEVDILTTLQFDIRFPLSYGFLRRFARCTRADTQTLNLARYILESSLMDQDMIEVIESKIAAGSLLLAFEMLHKTSAWDETAKYYTGYDVHELEATIVSLNKMITRFSRKRTVIREKYSHEPYMEVARIPLLAARLSQNLK